MFDAVRIRIKLTGSRIKDIKNKLNDMHQHGKTDFTIEFRNVYVKPLKGIVTGTDYRDPKRFIDFIKQSGELADMAGQLKEDSMLDVQDEFFERCVEFIRESRFLRVHEAIKKHEKAKMMAKRVHEFAVKLDELIKEVLREEIPFIKNLSEELQILQKYE